MDKKTQFIRTYEKIVGAVNCLAGVPRERSLQLKKAAKISSIVRKHQRRLTYAREVRNLLQHPQNDSVDPAVHVSDAFIEEMKTLLKYLRSPPRARRVGVPRSRVKVARLTDRLGDLAKEMKRKRFTHVPIVNERDVIIGVFNEAALFDYLWSEAETIIGRNMQISEIFHYCQLDADHTEIFKFVNPETPFDDLAEMFLTLQSCTMRVGVIFVTASGKADESFQRLITPWDVLEGFNAGAAGRGR